ncbi:MAG: hypothetical protein CSA72_13690 [Rhodobacterales bacterium]|nr:MAG: hypothetical protein CSA72_13690 [Rhodobacterales bacterium]
MSRMIRFAALAAVSIAAGCAASHGPATRGVPFDGEPLSAGAVAPAQITPLDVQDVRVSFLPGLKVSEANRYYPLADIVWRGDPIGDRFQQIHAIVSDAMARGVSPLNEGRAAVADVQITRFHCLTEKTRYSVGGTHSIKFNLTVRDAETGQVIDGPREVDASFPGLGGEAAIAADRMGQTQKVRITDQLAYVILQELGGAPQPVAVASN